MRRLRLAYFSPLPPQRTGVADYSAELLPLLAQGAQITLYHEAPERVSTDLAGAFELRPLNSYGRRRWEHDGALYHVGNNPHHASIYETALRYPGVVVFHDYYVHASLAHQAAERGAFPDYQRELAYARGPEGIRMAREVRSGARPRPDYDFPLNDRLLAVSLGAIVHNESVAADVRSRFPAQRLRVIPHFVRRLSGASRRHMLPWPEDAVILAHTGYITPNRRLDLALEAFRRLRSRAPQARFLIVGEVVREQVNVEALIAEHGLQGYVYQASFAPELQDFLDWVETADVIVNLRHPGAGESSGSALRALALGKPVVVFDHAWYGELPDQACYKVPLMDRDALLQAMEALATSEALRRKIGAAAARHAVAHHDPQQAAKAYLAFAAACLAAYS